MLLTLYMSISKTKRQFPSFLLHAQESTYRIGIKGQHLLLICICSCILKILLNLELLLPSKRSKSHSLLSLDGFCYLALMQCDQLLGTTIFGPDIFSLAQYERETVLLLLVLLLAAIVDCWKNRLAGIHSRKN